MTTLSKNQIEISTLDDFEAFVRSSDLTIDELSDIIEEIWKYSVVREDIKSTDHLLEIFLESARFHEAEEARLGMKVEMWIFLPKESE